MAKFTASIPLNLRLPGGFEVSGAAGATHRIPDALVEEFTRDQVPQIPGGVTWVTQDEASALASFDPATKLDKAGGTMTGGLVATAGLSVKSLNTSVIFADQYSSIQAAHDALPAAGGTIVVPAGTYTTSGQSPILEITKSNFRLVGAGRGATIFQWGTLSAGLPMYLIAGNASNIHDITIEGIEFTGAALPTVSTTYVAVQFANTGTRRITLRDLYIRQMPGTSETFGVNFGNVMGGVIDGVYVSNCAGTGIAVSGSTAIVIANCVADACGWMGFSISSADTSTQISSDITLTNCISRRNTRYGFNFESTEYLALSGLVSEGNGQHGMNIAAAGVTGIIHCRYVSGSGIAVIDNGTSTAGVYSGILIDKNGAGVGPIGIHLSGVVATDNKQTKTQHYGVISSASVSNCTVSGDLRGNLTGEASLTLGTNNQYRPTRFIGAAVDLSANISLANNTATVITWTAETHDVDGFHSLVSNTSRLTIPVGLAGKYRVTVNGIFGDNATGNRVINILKNGSAVAVEGRLAASGTTSTSLSLGWVGELAAGDYIEVSALQNSGGALNFVFPSWLMIERV